MCFYSGWKTGQRTRDMALQAVGWAALPRCLAFSVLCFLNGGKQYPHYSMQYTYSKKHFIVPIGTCELLSLCTLQFVTVVLQLKSKMITQGNVEGEKQTSLTQYTVYMRDNNFRQNKSASINKYKHCTTTSIFPHRHGDYVHTPHKNAIWFHFYALLNVDLETRIKDRNIWEPLICTVSLFHLSLEPFACLYGPNISVSV